MSDPIVRAQQAQSLLADPLLQEALTAIEKSVVSRLKTAKTQDEMTHWVMWLQLTEKFKGALVGYINHGKVEMEEQKRKEAKGKRG